MKRFEFKLGRLARVRKAQEQIARAEWQAAATIARDFEQALEAIDADIDRAFDFQRNVQATPELDPRHVLSAHEAIRSMERGRELLREQLQQAEAEAERLREPWQDLRTELEGLKRLEQSARGKHRVERERVEAAETDQVAIERATISRPTRRRRGA